VIGVEIERYLRELIREVVRAELGELGRRPGKHVSVKDYADARSIATSTVRAAIKSGRLPSIKVGRAVRVPADVEIATKTATPASDDPTALAERRLGLVRGGRS
jgi:excisionase family DNA binding protein